MQHHNPSTAKNDDEDDSLSARGPVGDISDVSDVTDVTRLRVLLSEARQERDEANHRIANSLQQATSFLRAQRKEAESSASHDVLLAAEMRLSGISQIHAHIGRGGNGHSLELDAFLKTLCGNLSTAFGLGCDIICDPITIGAAAANKLGIIMSELAINSVKYAYDGHEGGNVLIRCRTTSDRLQLMFIDHGPGLPDAEDMDRENPPGLGMSILAGAVESLNGTMTSHNNGGAVFLIDIPAP